MPCECRNADGTLSATCFGCKTVVNRIAENNSFTAKQLSQIQEIVNEAFLSVAEMQDDKWIAGFVTGFHQGVEHEKKY